jgi:hypothetical protein
MYMPLFLHYTFFKWGSVYRHEKEFLLLYALPACMFWRKSRQKGINKSFEA